MKPRPVDVVDQMRGEHPDPAGTGTTTAGAGASSGAPGPDASAADAGRDRVAEEFRRLLDAAAWRAEQYLRGAGGAEYSAHAEYAAENSSSDRPDPGSGRGRADEQRSGTASACGWCPICAVASLLRGERPELTSRLTEQLAGLIDVLRDSAAEHRGPHAESAEPTAGPGDSAAEPPAPRVQRIDVRRVRGRAAAQAPDAGRAAATGEFGC